MREAARDVNTAASQWLERVHAGNWTGDDQAALEAWLSQSHLNRATYWRLEAAWSDASRLTALGAARFQKEGAARKTGAGAVKIAASLALIATAGFGAAHYLAKPATETYRTSIGGRELVRFEDGTEIELNTDTVLRTRMTTKERTVWLDRGEAYFHVKHDPAHPFTVLVGKERVTDLGTEFVVQSDAAVTEVAVVKGRVRFDTPDVQSAVKTAMLSGGDTATASAVSMFIAKKSPAELDDALSWRRGVLVFRHTALGDAVNEFNRYNRVKLAIADPDAAAMPIGGVFRTDNLEDFTRAVHAGLGLNVRDEGGTIVISRK
jgi:transmembrane sensor